MLANVGHTIQKMINNTPVAITVNDTTSAVVTNGGNVYQAGFINKRIQHSFQEVLANENIVGKILDAEATEDKIYLLNKTGSVFEYDTTAYDCGPVVHEVYSPVACGGDKAVKIDAGRAHLLILTENNRVWGVGDNQEYQLVPQGQCKYDTAVEVIVTDTNLHDNNCCSSFTGVLNELESPIIPQDCEKKCNNISCIKDTLCDVVLGYLNIRDVTVSPPGTTGVLSVPVFGNVNYVGFLCVDKKGCVSGSVTYTITKIYIKCGCFIGKFTVNDNCGACIVREVNLSSTSEIILFKADPCFKANSDICCDVGPSPIKGTAEIEGKCGSCVTVNVDTPPGFVLPSVLFSLDCRTLTLTQVDNTSTTLAILCDGAIVNLTNFSQTLDLDFDIKLDCCQPYNTPKPIVELPQPCWTNIYAGFDTSVLVDNCNRLYVFGSIHNVRSNKDLLRKSCLEDLLNGTHASVNFPADQLNCSTTIRNDNCKCIKCRDKPFKTDLSKFGISLSFPNGSDCDNKSMNVCDFLKSLKQCNETPTCEPTCEPCDSYIHLNISGECGCPCAGQPAPPIGSVTIFNKRSICKLVSQQYPDISKVNATVNTIVEFDLNKYCIDAQDIALEKIVKLEFCNKGPNVNLFVDIDQPGGVVFTSNGKKCNVEFTVNASSQTHQFLLNFGEILDPVVLTNLKYALSIDCFYPCPRFKNPFDTKITNTYIKGGDHVRFIVTNPNNIRQAITADVPTVFRLNRRVLDVGVGYNNLSVLVGGLACPNEIFVIGNNCRGELGLGTNESIVCFKQINRCIFDCQVVAIFSGKYVTFYVTQSNKVYASGLWKCLVNSTVPEPVKCICSSWRIKQMAIASNHILLLGSDGSIFGFGDNTLGELGLCHLDCVPKPTPLSFFYKLNNNVAKKLYQGLNHPVERNYCKPKYDKCDGKYDDGKYGPDCGAPCGPPPPCPPCGFPKFPKFPKYPYYGKKYAQNYRAFCKPVKPCKY